MQYLTGSYRQATASLRRALELYRALTSDTRLEEASVLTSLGHPLNLIGTPRSKGHPEASARHVSRSGSCRLGEATALNRLGVLQTITGPYPEAIASQEKALDLYRSLSDPLGEAAALGNLGVVQVLDRGHAGSGGQPYAGTGSPPQIRGYPRRSPRPYQSGCPANLDGRLSDGLRQLRARAERESPPPRPAEKRRSSPSMASCNA